MEKGVAEPFVVEDELSRMRPPEPVAETVAFEEPKLFAHEHGDGATAQATIGSSEVAIVAVHSLMRWPNKNPENLDFVLGRTFGKEAVRAALAFEERAIEPVNLRRDALESSPKETPAKAPPRPRTNEESVLMQQPSETVAPRVTVPAVVIESIVERAPIHARLPLVPTVQAVEVLHNKLVIDTVVAEPSLAVQALLEIPEPERIEQTELALVATEATPTPRPEPTVVTIPKLKPLPSLVVVTSMQEMPVTQEEHTDKPQAEPTTEVDIETVVLSPIIREFEPSEIEIIEAEVTPLPRAETDAPEDVPEEVTDDDDIEELAEVVDPEFATDQFDATGTDTPAEFEPEAMAAVSEPLVETQEHPVHTKLVEDLPQLQIVVAEIQSIIAVIPAELLVVAPASEVIDEAEIPTGALMLGPEVLAQAEIIFEAVEQLLPSLAETSRAPWIPLLQEAVQTHDVHRLVGLLSALCQQIDAATSAEQLRQVMGRALDEPQHASLGRLLMRLVMRLPIVGLPA